MADGGVLSLYAAIDGTGARFGAGIGPSDVADGGVLSLYAAIDGTVGGREGSIASAVRFAVAATGAQVAMGGALGWLAAGGGEAAILM